MPKKRKTKITANNRELAQKMFDSRYPNRVIVKTKLVTKIFEITHSPRIRR